MLHDHRWDVERLSEEVLPAQLGSFLLGGGPGGPPGVDVWDPAAFGVSRAEAALMDPQQRLLMDACADVMAADRQRRPAGDAAPSAASPSSVGVFVGVSQLEYARITLEQNIDVNAFYATGRCSRVQYLDLSRAPSVRATAPWYTTAFASTYDRL